MIYLRSHANLDSFYQDFHSYNMGDEWVEYNEGDGKSYFSGDYNKIPESGDVEPSWDALPIDDETAWDFAPSQLPWPEANADFTYTGSTLSCLGGQTSAFTVTLENVVLDGFIANGTAKPITTEGWTIGDDAVWYDGHNLFFSYHPNFFLKRFCMHTLMMTCHDNNGRVITGGIDLMQAPSPGIIIKDTKVRFVNESNHEIKVKPCGFSISGVQTQTSQDEVFVMLAESDEYASSSNFITVPANSTTEIPVHFTMVSNMMCRDSQYLDWHFPLIPGTKLKFFVSVEFSAESLPLSSVKLMLINQERQASLCDYYMTSTDGLKYNCLYNDYTVFTGRDIEISESCICFDVCIKKTDTDTVDMLPQGEVMHAYSEKYIGDVVTPDATDCQAQMPFSISFNSSNINEVVVDVNNISHSSEIAAIHRNEDEYLFGGDKDIMRLFTAFVKPNLTTQVKRPTITLTCEDKNGNQVSGTSWYEQKSAETIVKLEILDEITSVDGPNQYVTHTGKFDWSGGTGFVAKFTWKHANIGDEVWFNSQYCVVVGNPITLESEEGEVIKEFRVSETNSTHSRVVTVDTYINGSKYIDEKNNGSFIQTQSGVPNVVFNPSKGSLVTAETDSATGEDYINIDIRFNEFPNGTELKVSGGENVLYIDGNNTVTITNVSPEIHRFKFILKPYESSPDPEGRIIAFGVESTGYIGCRPMKFSQGSYVKQSNPNS